jgi:glucosamine--fructose-6-phosphate aminotransferase (isomerizing)
MCGIVGYLGRKNARDIIVTGLERLEYRGYDSAGLTLFNEQLKSFKIYKNIGRVEKLITSTMKMQSHIGIGHTRWATHGLVSRANSHPHASESGRFVIVHNGVIENYIDLKDRFLQSHQFKSQTDTEVIAQLIEKFSQTHEVEQAILKTLEQLRGSYALLIIDTLNPNKLYTAKNKPPLLIGKDKDGITITSDMMALIDYATEYIDLEDKTFVVVTNDDIKLYDYGFERLGYQMHHFDMKKESSEKGIYPHYMLKEIHEQPGVLRKIIATYFDDEKVKINPVILDAMHASDKIYILAAGTSMYAGLASEHFLEVFTHKPVEVHIASEFAYADTLIQDNPFFILISQSGETADLRACLIKIREKGHQTLTVTNVATLTLAKEADFFLDIKAGPEIAVASTKAYVAQLAVLSILGYALSDQTFPIKLELSKVIQGIEIFLSNTENIKRLVSQKIYKQNAFYIGRGTDYATALEAALKLKEISYIHTEGFAAGELKHGTIALIEKGTPVCAIISNRHINLNTRSNLQEVISRGAIPIVITLKSLSDLNDDVILEDVHPMLAPILMVVPTQLIAYYTALNLGYDIDKPRNLAKSVTVE